MAHGELKRTTDLISAAVAILREQQPMTIRQLFYAVVVRELILNLTKDYKRVSRIMTKARNDDRCPWEWIVDRSRPIYSPDVWKDPAGYAQAVKRGYRKDYWEMQPNYVEVWVEKDAVIGSISDLCDELGVTIRPFKGFNSTTKVHEAAEWLSGITKPITIFYCGDHDASGRCIDEEGAGRVMNYGSGRFTLKRLAIHKSDIRRFNLPPQRVKDTDSRAPAFRKKYGDQTVELDALPPVELRRRIREAVESKLDQDKSQRAIEVEKVELASIVDSVSEWANNGFRLDGKPRHSKPTKTAPRNPAVERFIQEANSGLGAYLLPSDNNPFGRLVVLGKAETAAICDAFCSGRRLRNIAADHGLSEQSILRIAIGKRERK
jgi:hypothetical protein